MKVVFFCGDQSCFGIAHLLPLLESKFQINKVIIPTRKRWEIFHQTLQGEKFYKEKNSSGFGIKAFVKTILPAKVTRLLESIISRSFSVNLKGICMSIISS